VKRWLVALVLPAVVWGNPGFGQAEPETGSERLPALVFQYLDSPDSDEAERLLQAVQHHPDATIERVSRIIETERSYDSRAIGTCQTNGSGQGKAMDSRFRFLTYQPLKGICADRHLARVYRRRISNAGRRALGRTTSGASDLSGRAWFTRRAEPGARDN
jgi:hypothetical protein